MDLAKIKQEFTLLPWKASDILRGNTDSIFNEPATAWQKLSVFSAVRDASFNWNMDERLLAHFDAAPECNKPFDLSGGLFRFRIVPSGVWVGFVADLQVVIVCGALPVTGALRIARRKVFRLDRVRRKVVITLDDDGLVGFGYDRIFPNRFHNSSRSAALS